MKKKIVLVLLCLMIGAMVPACGNNGGSARMTTNQPAGVNDVLQAGIAEAEADKAEGERTETDEISAIDSPAKNAPIPEKNIETSSITSGTDGIDVDLTALSSTMVYSEVYNMMVSPDMYIGKTVKMDGAFSSFYDESTDVYYYACIIQDATACCAQGIEFELTDDYSYPDDYPEEGDNVCVVGVFDTYQEGEYTYCTLREAKLV